MATKAQLEERIAALEAELLARGKECEALRMQVAVIGGPEHHVDRHGRRWYRCTTKSGLLCYAMKREEPRQMPLGFVRARDEAMRTGRAIRVAA